MKEPLRDLLKSQNSFANRATVLEKNRIKKAVFLKTQLFL
jgi:hypothetical protein